MNNKTTARRIHVLRDSVAKRIAAGEVIDRPFSVVRELLDNSIDAGASEIALHVTGGGIKNIRCVDNGRGMSREDLELCFLPHSTSKIETIEDLDRLGTLGFRGEALASISACARLEISSKQKTDTKAHVLFINNGKKISLKEANTADGTIAEVSDLFYSIPARLKFLKRESSEAAACRNMFTEKAIAFPETAFRLFIDSKMKLFLPKSTLRERVIAANGNAYPGQLTYQAEKDFGSFSITLVMTGPAVYRKDRRQIHIYVNKRRIQEFALVQAAEYGYTGYLPGGCFPVISVFIEIKPELVDFNIHPAKKEIKIMNIRDIHRALVSLIQEELKGRAREVQSIVTGNQTREAPETSELFPESSPGSNTPSYSRSYSGVSAIPNRIFPVKADSLQKDRFSTFVAENKNSETEPETVSDPDSFTYFGQIFTTFLLCLKNDKFYFIDQHAAHEKILYEELVSRNKEVQDLLVPLLFAVENDIDAALQNNIKIIGEAGIAISRISRGEWQITGLTPLLASQQENIVAFLQEENAEGEKFSQKFYADLACKSAIKDGDLIDDVQAAELIKKTFRLANPRCPHGRPVWFTLTKEELFRFVGRII